MDWVTVRTRMRPAPVRLATVAAILVLAAPLAAAAQPERVWRIGYLASVAADNPPRLAFRQRLRELGYVEGQNVVLEIRSSEGRVERFPALAAELVRLRVDVIVTGGDPPTGAAQKATSSIPIVMIAATDPIASGFVASLARPGGNVTGLTAQSQDVAGKALQLLKEAVPNLSRVAVLWDPTSPGSRRSLSEVEAAATALKLHRQSVEVRSPGELDSAIAAASKGRADAAFIFGRTLYPHSARIAALAVKHRLPTVGLLPEFARDGWLVGYGTSLTDQSMRAADFVDQILKGAKPAELPVEQPTKFYLAINLKTAKALGLRIPHRLLQRADQVID
jgi:putative ABC transport system substrate-binding protein